MRLKIALRNLVISQIFILLFLAFAYFIWFPYSFLGLGGFTKTALMLVFVDLVLGPLLVFIIFREGKKHLQFDINVLLSIQIIAFLFGAYSLYLKHPVYAVFKNNRFILTNVSQLYPEPTLIEQLKNTVFTRLQLVTAKFPNDMEELMGLMIDVDLFGAPDIENRPKYFSPMMINSTKFLGKSLHIKDIVFDKNIRSKLHQFIRRHGGKVEDYAYYPLTGNNKKDMIWVFDRHTTQPIGIIDGKPWADNSHYIID